MENTFKIDLSQIDIEPYRKGNTGIPFVTTFDSGIDGPHVMIMAVTHGNELCGAIALDWLFEQDVRPRLGKLSLGFSNWRAYQAFDPSDPYSSRFIDEDINRVWDIPTLDGPRKTVETDRARELRPIIDQVDLLLDIHSMTTFCDPLMICGPLKKGQELAKVIGIPKYIVSDRGHSAGMRMRDYGDFSDDKSGKNSLLIECGQHWEKHSMQVAHDVALRFLGSIGIIDRDFMNENLKDNHLPEQRVIEVSEPYTITADQPFTWKNDYKGLELIQKKGTILGWDGNNEVRTPYENCVLIMPNKLKGKGHSAVRFGKFIEK